MFMSRQEWACLQSLWVDHNDNNDNDEDDYINNNNNNNNSLTCKAFGLITRISVSGRRAAACGVGDMRTEEGVVDGDNDDNNHNHNDYNKNNNINNKSSINNNDDVGSPV